MAKPITWRTINSPNFNTPNPSSAFNSATQGALALSESLFGLQDRLNTMETNRELARALQTGVVPTGNPRVDTAQILDAINADKVTRSNLTTASLNQEGKRTQNALDELGLRDYDEDRTLSREDTLSQIATREGNLAVSQAQERRMTAEAQAAEEELAERRRKEQTLIDIEKQYGTDVANEAARISAIQDPITREAVGTRIREEVQGMLNSGMSPQDPEVQRMVAMLSAAGDSAFGAARQEINATAVDNVLSRYANDEGRAARLGLTGAEYATTTPGARLAALESAAFESAQKRRDAQEAAAQFQYTSLENASNGDLSAVKLDARGNVVPATKSEVKNANYSGVGQWKSEVRAAGYNEDELSDDTLTAMYNLLGGHKQALDFALNDLQSTQYLGFGDRTFDQQKAIETAQAYASDLRTQAGNLLREQVLSAAESPADGGLAAFNATIGNLAADSEFKNKPQVEQTPRTTATNSPRLAAQLETGLDRLDDFEASVVKKGSVHPKVRKIIDDYRSILSRGTLTGVNPAFTSRSTTKRFDDADLKEKLEDLDKYLKRQGF